MNYFRLIKESLDQNDLEGADGRSGGLSPVATEHCDLVDAIDLRHGAIESDLVEDDLAGGATRRSAGGDFDFFQHATKNEVALGVHVIERLDVPFENGRERRQRVR